MTPQPLPEGYDPDDYIAVKVLRVDADDFVVRCGYGLACITQSHAFALPVPAPTPPAWATQPHDGWHTTMGHVRAHKLEWRYVDRPLWHPVSDWCSDHDDYPVVAREPQRRTAATILDEIGRRFANPVALDLLAEYRAALTAEAGQ